MSRQNLRLFLVLMLFVFSATSLLSADFKRDIEPILKKHCYRCHTESNDESELYLDQLDPNIETGKDTGFWHEALNQLNEGRMPPKEAQPLTDRDLISLTTWLESEIRKASELRRDTGGRQVMRRMNRYEYQYTLEDILGIALDYREHLPPDLSGDDGLKTNGSLLGMSPVLMEAYLKVADMALLEAIPDAVQPVLREKLTSLQVTTIRGQKKRNNKSQPKIPLADGVKPKPSIIAPTFGLKQTAFDHDLPRKVTFEKRPFSGRFAITIELKAEPSTNGRTPELTVLVGHRASGDYTPKKILGQIMINPTDELQSIRMVGDIENFPLGNKEGYYNGSGSHDVTHLSVWIWNTATPQTKVPFGTAIQDIDEPLLDIRSVSLEGPLLGGFPSERARELLPALTEESDQQVAAADALALFLRRVFRRSVTQADVEKYLSFFNDFRDITGDYRTAMRKTFATAMLSPEFIFLLEPTPSNSQPRTLTAHELATRMSYFLWASAPDLELLNLADSGELLDEKVLHVQVTRMRNDPRFKRFTDHFTTQWLGLDRMQHVAVNPETFPEFSDELREDLVLETSLFSGYIFDNDLSLKNLIRSDFAIVNRELAKHYGISHVDGAHFRRVDLGDQSRPGGILPQGTISLLGSDGMESNPIYRGVWLNKRLFADPPPPPPPGAPPLEETNRENLTLKQQIALHRKAAACARCHDHIDPWGIAFEQFNALGQLKGHGNSTDQSVKFDASTTLPDGTEIKGMRALQDHLIEARSEEFAEAVVRRISEYALGRKLDFSDEDTIVKLSRRLIENDFRPSSLLEDVVMSKSFRSK